MVGDATVDPVLRRPRDGRRRAGIAARRRRRHVAFARTWCSTSCCLSVAGPLLAFGMPLPTLLWALPHRPPAPVASRSSDDYQRHARSSFPDVDRRSRSSSRRSSCGAGTSRRCTRPRCGTRAARVEHASFLLVATAAWWSVTTGPPQPARRGRDRRTVRLGPGHGARRWRWCSRRTPGTRSTSRASVAAALANQQLAGVIMWAFGGMAAVDRRRGAVRVVARE